MSISKAKQRQFPSADLEQWRETAEKSLRGKSLESLEKETDEGITLSPLYTKEMADGGDQVPGSGQFIRGLRMDGQSWTVVQKRDGGSWDALLASVKDGLAHGEEAVAFNADVFDADSADFTGLAELGTAPLFVTADREFSRWAEKLLAQKQWKPHGVFAADFLAARLGEGLLPEPGGRPWKEWQQAVAALDRQAPELKTVMVSLKPYADAGANAAQEMAAALGEAVFYLEACREMGWEPEKTAGKLIFHFAAGSSFFLEVAKFRTFRKLWSLIADAYGLDPALAAVSAETSSYTESVLDPHVNMLRAGNAAFAAVIGGVDYLHVAPFDGLYAEENPFSLRIARNTQLLLREEAYLDKVADPAGGSYYVESLTEELAEKAWELFLELEDEGGIEKSLQSGFFQGRIAAVRKKKERDAETRKKTLIGVNEFSRIEEEIRPAKKDGGRMNSTEGFRKAEPLAASRLAETFEELRLKADGMRKAGKEPVAGLILLGKLKDYKPRADYVTGVLAAGGIRAELSPGCLGLQDVETFITSRPSGYYCLCGTDEAYREMAEEAVKLIRRLSPGSIIDLAGKVDLPEAGNDGAIFAGQNIAEKLSGLLDLIGGGQG